jgi:hypothetical protein
MMDHLAVLLLLIAGILLAVAGTVILGVAIRSLLRPWWPYPIWLDRWIESRSSRYKNWLGRNYLFRAKDWRNEHGLLHRVDGPALIRPDGTQYWCQHGELHRADGPAVILSYGRQYWYVKDQNITAEVEAWMGANSITWPFNESQQMEFALRWL